MLFPAPIKLLACNLFSHLWDEKKKVAVKKVYALQHLVKVSPMRRPIMMFKATEISGKEKHILTQHSHPRM